MHQSKKSALADLALIDVARLPGDPAALAAIDRACRNWGCFLICGFERISDLQPALIADLQRAMQAFFALEADRKHAVQRTASNAWGYYDQELTKNTRDWKEIYDIGPAYGDTRPQWPLQPAGFRAIVERYYRACESLAFPLLRALSTCLGMPERHLDAAFDGHSSFLRLNHYAPCPDPGGPDDPDGPGSKPFGINHHTDSGALTILLQDQQPGLQLSKDGRWHLIRPVPGTLTVNIGDVVQVWSNDHYPAPVHRVLASRTRHRYSAPFFFNPAFQANYAPLPSVCATEPARYRAINWGEFRSARAAGDYADIGAEIQIAHFRSDNQPDQPVP